MKPQNENAPAFTRNRGANQSKSNNISISPLETILGKLDGARPSGDGWRADCPNGHRSHFSLSFKQVENGSVLLHCHSGCGPQEVMRGLGLTLADLYDRPIDTKPQFAKRTPAEVKEYRLKAAFKYLPKELLIVQVASLDLLQGKPLDEDSHIRLELAVERIRSAGETLYVKRP